MGRWFWVLVVGWLASFVSHHRLLPMLVVAVSFLMGWFGKDLEVEVWYATPEDS